MGFRLEDRQLDGYAISGISCKIVDNLENTISDVYSCNYLDGSSIVKTVPINLARGDVDYSGVLTVSDADAIIDYIAYLVDFSNVQKVLADYNQDGYVNVSDAVAIKAYLANRGDDVSEIEKKLQHYLCTGLIKYAN